MRVLLVPVSNRPESKTALQVTTGIARRLDADIIGCHLRPHRDADQAYKPVGVPLFSSADSDWLDAQKQKGSASATRQAQKLFNEVIADADIKLVKQAPINAGGSSAIWREMVGSPNKLLAIMGPVSDLTVLTRPTANGRVAKMFLLAALLHSGRPVLLLPPRQTQTPGTRIAIAWNQGAEVSRTVSACMPMLQTAEQVNIISCGPENRPGPKASHLKEYLRHYGIKSAVLKTRGRDETQELLEAYRDSKSNLMLMGAYSRSRFREIVFGGMTEKMLWNAKIPVIMQHGAG
jgi:nucleotide-binding universal stress UspA family protein